VPVQKIICPACQAVLKSTQPVPAGKKIKCPKCQKLFVTAAPEPEVVEEITEATPAAAVKPPKRKTKHDPHDEETVEVPAKALRKASAEYTEAPPRRPAPPADEDDEADDDTEAAPRPAKKKNLGFILACVGGGAFIGMFVCMILMVFFASSEITTQIRQQGGGFKMQFQDKGPDQKAIEEMFKNMPK
jgi:phage FluMu protein Com